MGSPLVQVEFRLSLQSTLSKITCFKMSFSLRLPFLDLPPLLATYFAITSGWIDLASFWKKWRNLVDLGRFGENYHDLDEIWWILANVGGFW